MTDPVNPPDPPPLIVGIDFYTDEQGRLVFTAAYLLKRGYCCHNGCRHCPYTPNETPS